MLKIVLITIAIIIAIESCFVFQEAIDNKSVVKSLLWLACTFVYCALMLIAI